MSFLFSQKSSGTGVSSTAVVKYSAQEILPYNKLQQVNPSHLLCQISCTIHAINCLYYNLNNSVIQRHVFTFVKLFRFVGEQIGFEVLVFGLVGPDIEPGRCTFLSILVFRIFF